MQKILVVEDDFDIRELLQNFLQEAGYEVATANDGIEALSLFSGQRYDLIILDILLPKIDGYGVCELIRKQSDVPIIMLTALSGEEDQIRGLDLQVDDYITKPFSPVVLQKKIAVLTSGGDAPGMNAAIRAVVRTALHHNIEVMGVHRGYSGLLNGEMFPMNRSSVSDIIQRGGTILRTARCEEFKKEEVRKEAVKILQDNGVDALVVIGGDGSFTGAKLLSKLGVKTIGLPGTIDNDLTYTDYTIGFDTALNTVTDAVDKIRDTSTSHERVSIVEVMGRNCGDIALYAGIACGAEYIITPEKGYDKKELCDIILDGKKKGKMHNLILLAEGVGGASELAKYIENETKIEARATVLGHVQRGGSPSAFDRVLASRMGSKAIELLLEGKTSRVVGIRKNEIYDVDIDEALALDRTFDDKLFSISSEINS